MAEKAGHGGWEHVPYLDEWAGIQAEERGERRIARLLGESKWPREKTLATLELNRFPSAVRHQITRLSAGEFLTGATNVCIFGHPGTGKTPVMAAIGHELVRHGQTVFFTPVSALERLLFRFQIKSRTRRRGASDETYRGG